MAFDADLDLTFEFGGLVFTDAGEFLQHVAVNVARPLARELVTRYVYHFAHQTFAQLVRLSPVRTGRMRRGWRVEYQVDVTGQLGGEIVISNPDGWYWVFVNGGAFVREAAEIAREHTLTVFRPALRGRPPPVRGVVVRG